MRPAPSAVLTIKPADITEALAGHGPSPGSGHSVLHGSRARDDAGPGSG
jgi:hypothetical protein